MLGSCHGGGEKTTSATTSSTESAMKTAGAVEMDPESCNEGSSFFRNFLGLDGDERGQLQGEVGPGFDPDPAGNGEGEGELEGDVYIEPQPLEGEVPYTPEDTVG